MLIQIWYVLSIVSVINAVRNLNENYEKKRPTFLLQYYSWWSRAYNQEDINYENTFVDPFDFEAIGVQGISNCSSDNPLRKQAFDLANFKYIRSIGYDALSWQIDPGTVDPPIDQIREAGLKVAPFVDVVQYAKMLIHESMTATVPDFVMSPTEQCMNLIVESMRKPFYEIVPKDLYARDAKGRIIIYVFFFKWESDLSHSSEIYDNWVEKLFNKFVEMMGEKPTLYINYNEGDFLLHLFQNYRNNFVPFNFVSDSSQGQYGHDSVTWNFGFDNFAVQKRDHLERVIRVDARFVTEQAFLAAATEPAAVFTYGWNEPFESSMLFPTKIWGNTKALVAKYYIENYDQHSKQYNLPKTILILNDFLSIREKHEHQMRLQTYWVAGQLRLYIPQADVITNKEVNLELLEKYEIIVDISLVRDDSYEKEMIERAEKNNQRVIIFDYSYKHLHEDKPKDWIHKKIQVLDKHERSDGKFRPIIIKNSNTIHVSSFRSFETRLYFAFMAIYDNFVEMKRAVTFTEQRVRVDPDNKEISYHVHDQLSVIREIPLPTNVKWFRDLQGLPVDGQEKEKLEKFAYNVAD